MVQRKIITIVGITSLIIMIFIYSYPLVLTIGSSFKRVADLFGRDINPFPTRFTLDNFRHLFRYISVGNVLMNSLIIAILTVASNVLTSPIIAYPLVKSRFRGRRIIFGLVIFMMVQPFISVLIPLYIVVVHLGLSNTYLGIALPFLINPLIIFLFRQSFMSIPDALIDSARIDGASEIRILFRIILPMVPAVIIVSGIISFLGSWNNFLWPLLAVRSVDMWTYPIALANLATTTTIMYGDIFALTTIYLVPLVIVFALLQEQFVRGFTVTGMKG